jgi:ribose transport system permease protein
MQQTGQIPRADAEPTSRPARPDAARAQRLKSWGAFAQKYAIVWVMLGGLVAASLVSDAFLTSNNIQNVLSQNAPLGLVALGMTFVMIGGKFDLSTGAIVGASTVTAAKLADNYSPAIVILGTVLAGAMAGAINGALVTLLRVNAFVATLATGSMFTGLALLYTNSQTIVFSNRDFSRVSTGSLFGVRTSAIIVVVLYLVLGFVLAKSVYGRALYATGGNVEAARLAGLRVDGIQASTFVLVGAAAGAAGMLYASLLTSGEPTIGSSITLDAITAVVIGGTSLFGGRGSVWRTAVGLVLLASITNVFDLLAIESAWQLVTKGGLLILAVALDVSTRQSS